MGWAVSGVDGERGSDSLLLLLALPLVACKLLKELALRFQAGGERGVREPQLPEDGGKHSHAHGEKQDRVSIWLFHHFVAKTGGEMVAGYKQRNQGTTAKERYNDEGRTTVLICILTKRRFC